MQPATLRHPESGLETLQLYAFSHGQTHIALEGYRLARADRPELPQVRVRARVRVRVRPPRAAAG